MVSKLDPSTVFDDLAHDVLYSALCGNWFIWYPLDATPRVRGSRVL